MAFKSNFQNNRSFCTSLNVLETIILFYFNPLELYYIPCLPQTDHPQKMHFDELDDYENIEKQTTNTSFNHYLGGIVGKTCNFAERLCFCLHYFGVKLADTPRMYYVY